MAETNLIWYIQRFAQKFFGCQICNLQSSNRRMNRKTSFQWTSHFFVIPNIWLIKNIASNKQISNQTHLPFWINNQFLLIEQEHNNKEINFLNRKKQDVNQKKCSFLWLGGMKGKNILRVFVFSVKLKEEKKWWGRKNEKEKKMD